MIKSSSKGCKRITETSSMVSMMMIMMTMMMLLMKETSSMVSGNLVFRVSGSERTSKPDMRHKLMNTLVMRLIMR